MRKVLFFMLTTLDGYFEGPNQDISWHNAGDEEFNQFAIQQLDNVDTLIFGRLTYELMVGYWTTDFAKTNDPIVAAKMNSTPKLVFSKTLEKVAWENTRLIHDNYVAEMRALKQQPGKDMVILGSSDLAVTFIEHGLIDEYRIMLNPLALGGGKPLFQGIPGRLDLKLVHTRVFKSGNVLLYYVPAEK
jgi:dihydrofolate reductase